MEKLRLNDFFYVYQGDQRGGGHYTVGMIVMLESSGEILGTNFGKVILNMKHLSFLVQVIDRGHLNAAGGYAEGHIGDKYVSFC